MSVLASVLVLPEVPASCGVGNVALQSHLTGQPQAWRSGTGRGGSAGLWVRGELWAAGR